MSNPSRFVWHDLSTNDVEGAKRFYGELFGWSFEQSGNDPYNHIQAGDCMIGGLRKKGEGEPGPPSWMGYVLVDAVPETVERATAGGGMVYVPTTTMPGVGTFAVVADPTGGIVAPWRSARDGENVEPSEPPAVNTFCWDELFTNDPAAATAFYTSVFGWDSEVRDMGEMGEYTVFIRPDVKDVRCEDRPSQTAGLLKAPPMVPHSFWLAYVLVEDSDATSERAAGLGATITIPPTDIPEVGRFCTFMDPEGAALAFISSPDA